MLNNETQEEENIVEMKEEIVQTSINTSSSIPSAGGRGNGYHLAQETCWRPYIGARVAELNISIQVNIMNILRWQLVLLLESGSASRLYHRNGENL